MQNKRIAIEYEDVDNLKEFPGNPRIWGDKAKNDVERSIKKHGFINPLLVNSAPGRENTILSGNLRLVVARELGINEVPIVRVYVTNPKIERELLLIGNINNGDWDIEILKGWDIDLLFSSGMKEFDISAILDNSLETENDDFSVDKELAKITKPKTKPGQIFQLGKHVLGCGSATDQAFVKKVAGGQLADVIYCDPPFNISLDYNSGLGGKSSYGGKTNDNLNDADYKAFLKKTIENALLVAKPDCHVFYYSDPKYIGLIQEIYQEVEIKNKRVCLWVKNGFNPTPGVAFNRCYEPCTYGVRGEPFISPKCQNLTEILNKGIATGNRQLDDILDIWDVWLAKRLAGQSYSHPTEKSVTLHEKPLRRCSKVNDVVLDLFCGSFSTGAACEQLKRKCITLDLDPIFCDLAINRFKKLTGQDAKLISEGGQNDQD